MMTDFNLPLLRKAIEWAESEAIKPRAESEWYQSYFAIGGEQIGRTCNTAYCVAGWIADQDGGHEIAEFSIDGTSEARVAQDLLGIASDDAWGNFGERGLFNASNTIEDVREIAERIARRYGEEL